MASWQSHVIGHLLRKRLKPRLGSALASGDIEKIRKLMGHSAQAKARRGCSNKIEVIGGVSGEWSFVEGVAAPVILYLHGGGYISASPGAYRGVTSTLANNGFRVFCPDYRLAPEAQFPLQIEDALSVYRGLLERGIQPSQLAIAGDSAGGNLALALCIKLREARLPQPSALVLFSPCVDWSASGNSVQSNSARCCLYTKQAILDVATMYLGDASPEDPLASPLYASLEGLPPMLIHVGENEVLLDDSLRLADKAKQAGTEVEVRVWPTVPHVWQLSHRVIPEGRQSLEAGAIFLKLRMPAHSST